MNNTSTEQLSATARWEPLILSTIPENFGIYFKTIVDKTIEPSLKMDDPPLTPLAYAVFDLASRGVLQINGQVIRMGHPVE
jgi:hypothetical protein